MRAVSWNGRYASGHFAYPGRYVFKVYAQNAYGPVDARARRSASAARAAASP